VLGRFRLSFTDDAATLQATRNRFDLKEGELVELAVLLATAHALQSQRDEAVTTLVKALDLMTDRASKARLVTGAAPLEGVLEQLTERATADGALQAELARHFAQHGNNQLAEAAVTKARPLLNAQLVKEPENTALAGELADLLLAEPTRWTVLKPAEMTADGGATLTRLEDNSILLSGPNPERDVYTLTFRDLPARFQHLRLEVLPHESLPHNGPGRCPEHGNFVLTTIKAQLDPPTNKNEPRSLKMARAVADINPQDWNVARAMDAHDSTGWAVHYEMGKPHFAVFEVAEPVTEAIGTVLHVTFECKMGRQHNLGRFRLSVSGDPAALDREEKHLAVMKLTDPWARLAAAYAENGRNEEAAQAFGKALQRTSRYEARKPIVEAAARFDEVLAALNRGQRDDPQLALALARRHAERGKQQLAEKLPARAQAELERARDIYGGLLAKYPEPRWVLLTPLVTKSEGGATLTLLDDGSILASGANPDRDVYVIDAEVQGRIESIRLEAIPHPSLPHGSSGRRVSDGNFAITEFKIEQAADGHQGAFTPVPMRSALCDYAQPHSPIMNVLDRRDDTFWDILPHIRERHFAVFKPERPLAPPAGLLRFTLEFKTQHREALGRFRLSVTDDPTAFPASQIRQDLKDSELVDVYAALAKAYSQQGRTMEAVASLNEALDRATDRAAKAKLVKEAAPLEGVLEKLSERAAADGPLLAELARHFAQRGNNQLADAATTKARPLLQAQLVKEPENTALAGELADLLLADPTRWTVLTPAEMTADGGATLTRLEDNSILLSGPNPEKDVYTLTFRDLPARIQHLRLEVLPHESLPNNGPGRCPINGNFVLTTIKAQLNPPANKSEPRSLKLARACADFSQQDFNVAGAIDANDTTGWAINPEMGKPHCALFEVVEPVTLDAGAELRVTFECKWGAQNNLGRFRLSVSGDPAALDREEKHLAVMNLIDPWARLAAAYAMNGRNEEASQAFGKALQRASSFEARKPIVEAAARFDELLAALCRGQPDDPQLLLALARQQAERGNAPAAEAARTKARTRFEEKLAAVPENAALAADLAEVLLDAQMPTRVPTSEKEGVPWRFSTSQPPADWMREEFDDSKWTTGLGSFGNGWAPGLVLRTPWTTSDIWLRRKFEWKLNPVIQSMVARVAHDDSFELFINGQQVLSRQEWRGYTYYPLEAKVLGLLKPGTNTMAVHCYSILGPQYIDVGLCGLSSNPRLSQLGLTATRIADPWAKLAATYHVLGDPQALDHLLKQRPAAAAGLGELYAAEKDWERAITEYRKAVTDQPADVALLTKLAAAYESAGRTREAVPYLARWSAANPGDTLLSLKVAALQAWFGQEKELAATRKQMLALAQGTNNADLANIAARICSLAPATDAEELAAALALGHTGAKLHRNEWTLLSPGMAEYRSGNYAAADEVLASAANANPNNQHVVGTAAFYRAMSLFRQGKQDEAREVASAAAAKMQPLPRDENNPLASGANWDDLILWLAYKEAKALLKFDATPPP
jgi:hypothetical protein